MLPLDAISFEHPAPGAGPTLFFSLTTEDALGLVCEFGGSQGVIWLGGPEAGKPARLEGLQGFYVPVKLEAELASHITGSVALPNGALLKSSTSTAVKSASGTGAARYYAVAGSVFGEPSAFAAFSRWQAVIEANGTRHILVSHGRARTEPMGGSEER